MNDLKGPSEQNNIEKIEFGDLLPKIQDILGETGGDVFRLLEKYVDLERRVNTEVVDLRAKNAELEAKLAEQTRNKAIDVVSDPMSPEYLRNMVNELVKTNSSLNKTKVSLEQQLVESKKNATVDALTGISNRRYFLQEFPKLISLVHRGLELNNNMHRGKISMIFFDLDHFKQVNDKHGHENGDVVLRSVGDFLVPKPKIPKNATPEEIKKAKAEAKERYIFREADIVARYGGEEFVVILPNCDVEGAKAKAEQIRVGIEALPFNFKKESVTASFGVATVELPMDKNLTNKSIENLKEGLQKASDDLLYEVKRSGRNNVKGKKVDVAIIAPELSDIDKNTPTSAVDVVDEMPNGA